MESNLNNRDFERFLKQNADQYRMFPSDKVWEGIHSALHTRRRWYGIAFVLLFFTAALITALLFIPSGNNEKQPYTATAAGTQKNTSAASDKTAADTEKNISTTVPAGPVSPVKNNRDFTATYSDVQKIFTGDNTSDRNDNSIASVPAPDAIPYGTEDTEQLVSLTALQKPDVLISPDKTNSASFSKTSPLYASMQASSVPSIITAGPDKIFSTDKAAALKKDNIDINKKSAEGDLKLPAKNDPAEKKVDAKAAKKILSWQLYLTPTVSYRSLSENTEYLNAARYNSIVNGGPSVVYPSDINSAVSHRPDLGFQLGLRSSYPVSKWFSITGGLQLSVSKYDIKAYDHPAEVATIALRDRSVSAVSNYRNTNGYKENWLRNFYFSASLPIGMELKLSDGEDNYFGVAGTLQPTYVLDKKAYLISADYKNYAEIPSLTRNWNMNTSFEIFSAHKTGKVNWRIGPQVRYQVMSSFKKNYPIKEHLFDFGLKLGIQLK